MQHWPLVVTSFFCGLLILSVIFTRTCSNFGLSRGVLGHQWEWNIVTVTSALPAISIYTWEHYEVYHTEMHKLKPVIVQLFDILQCLKKLFSFRIRCCSHDTYTWRRTLFRQNLNTHCGPNCYLKGACWCSVLSHVCPQSRSAFDHTICVTFPDKIKWELCSLYACGVTPATEAAFDCISTFVFTTGTHNSWSISFYADYMPAVDMIYLCKPGVICWVYCHPCILLM